MNGSGSPGGGICIAAFLLYPCKAAWTGGDFAQNGFITPTLNIAIFLIFDDSGPDRSANFDWKSKSGKKTLLWDLRYSEEETLQRVRFMKHLLFKMNCSLVPLNIMQDKLNKHRERETAHIRQHAKTKWHTMKRLMIETFVQRMTWKHTEHAPVNLCGSLPSCVQTSRLPLLSLERPVGSWTARGLSVRSDPPKTSQTPIMHCCRIQLIIQERDTFSNFQPWERNSRNRSHHHPYHQTHRWCRPCWR